MRAILLLVAGFLIARLVGRALAGAATELHPHSRLLLRRASTYAVLSLFAVLALHELGFSIGVLLGAAGVLSVAIGFASQTSASNLVSGLFLIGERPFSIGDVIQVGQTTGEVISIDLLSLKLRTFDNLYVRIPNESLIKSEIKNMSRFPIRRIDLQVAVPYSQPLTRVREVLEQVAVGNPLYLEEPRPLFMLLGFGESAVDVQFSVWSQSTNFLELRNSMYQQILEQFAAADISIPFPHRTLVGADGSVLPVRIVDSASTS